MSSVNKVIIIGRLGADPEIRHSANGNAICNISVATTYKRKDANGQQVEETEWHRIVMFNRLAEIAGEYLRKGRSVYIEGRLQTRKWQDKNGQDKYTTEIIADQMQMLGGRDDGQQQGDYQQQNSQPSGHRQQPAQPQKNYQAAVVTDGMDDMSSDIPF